MFPLDNTQQLQCLNPLLKFPTISRYAEWLRLSVSDCIVDCVQRSTDLKTLKIRSCSFQPLASSSLAEIGGALAGNTTLRVLSLDSTHIPEVSLSLASSLKVNSTLTKLILSRSGVTDEGVSVIGEALAVNSSLTTLNLSFNHISNNSFGPLSTGLGANFTLRMLDLGTTGLLFESASAIVAALKTNAALTHLNLQGNPIFSGFGGSPSDEMLKGFITDLSQIPSLTTLHLGRTDMRQKHLSMLLNALPLSTDLKSLHLGSQSNAHGGFNNQFEADCTKEIAHSINNGLTNLSTLDLSFTGITAEAIMPIAEALKTNSTLTILNVDGNPLGDEGAGHLAAMLATNSTLTTLSIRDSDETVRLRDNLIRRHYREIAEGLELELPIIVTTQGLKSLEAAMTVNTMVTSIILHPRVFIQNTRAESVMMIKYKDNERRAQNLFKLLFDKWGSSTL